MPDASDKLSREKRSYDLEAGALTLMTLPVPGAALFQIAERINPKRSFLFVSTVLGRHIPVHPGEHRAVLRQLADGVTPLLLDGPVFVMGFAETAVGIGAGVFDCLRTAQGERDIGYLTTTRFAPSGSSDWFMIEESHSHAVDHIILWPRSNVLHQGMNVTLVLVDDETTTGKTFSELALGLFAQGLTFGRVVLVTLTDWSDGYAEKSVKGIFGDADVCSVSLQRGTWKWAAKEGWSHTGLPENCATQCPPWNPNVGQKFAAPRIGIASSDERQSGRDILADMETAGFVPVSEQDRVLIVGAGEHVWQPMLAAEALSASGLYTRFITTTRSPILEGETIRNKFSFPDHYGEGFYMYIHNVVPSDWDRIVLFTETGADGIAASLVNFLGCVDVVDGNGVVTVLTAQGPMG